MPKRKKSNLSKKSRDAKKHKKVNASQSEEDHNKRLHSNLIAVKKYRNGQTKEEKETRLAKHRILDQLNSSQIIKEHNDHIRSQKKSQVSMRTRNSIKRKSETVESKSTKKRNLRQFIEEDRSTSNNEVHNETYLEDNNNISDDFDFSDIENQQPDEDHDKSALEDNNLDISDDLDFSLSDFETQQPHVSTQFTLYM